MITGALLLLAGPVVFLCLESHREIARWYAAASDEQRLSGEYKKAIEHLTTAIAWDEQSAPLLIQRAQLKSQLGDWKGALADCDAARKLPGGDLLSAAIRTECLHRMGEHAKAIQQWRELLETSPDGLHELDRAQLLNGLAYACAVGNLDLQEALDVANEAVQLSVNEAAVLDPEGVYYAARADMEQSLGRMSAALKSYQLAGKSAAAALQREQLRYEALQNSGSETDERAEEYRRRFESLQPHLAGILAARADLYEELDKPNEAKRDREMLDSLSKDGNRSLAIPLTWTAAMLAISNSAAILDTRGLIYYHMGDLEKALQDTENAVKSAEWQLKAFDWMDENNRNYAIDLRRQEEARRERAKSVAVIRYHRLLVLEKLGKTKRAAEDRARIEQLGHEPDDQLF
jgi:tetratricopeptide (TPR) repeat protein